MGGTRKSLFAGLGLLLIVSIIAYFILLPTRHRHRIKRESPAQQLQYAFDHSPMILNSHEKYNAVHIPFTLRDNIIRVQTIWSGKPVEAILDTGSGFIAWPRSIHLECWRSGIPQKSFMAGNVIKQGEWTMLPSIKAGNCEWQQVPTVADGDMEGDITSQPKAHLLKVRESPEPLLGAPAFQRVVLTIDYQKKEIIVRRSEYDITHLPRHPHDILLSPEWEGGYLPLVKGRLGGHPARFALDTGCDTLPVSTQFVKRWPAVSAKCASETTVNGVQVSLTGLRYISGSISGIKFQEYRAQVVDVPTSADALFGTAILDQYRVTIDYTRHKVLLEPYSQELNEHGKRNGAD